MEEEIGQVPRLYCQRQGQGQENEKRMGGGLAQAAGGRSRRRKLPLVVLIPENSNSPQSRTHLARSLLKTSAPSRGVRRDGTGMMDRSRVRRNQREKLNGEEEVAT